MTLILAFYDVVARRRVARKAHVACGGNCPTIQPGEVYLSAVHFYLPRPTRAAICARHALEWNPMILDPMPYDQLARQGLL